MQIKAESGSAKPAIMLIQQLSQLLVRLAPSAAEIVIPFLSPLYEANQRGDVCLPINRDQQIKLLQATPLVARSGNAAPLIIDGERLYLGRHWLAEYQIAERLGVMSHTEDEVSVGLARQVICPFLNNISLAQQHALALALRKRLLIISGGPGTGKTSTVVRLMAALQCLVRQCPNMQHTCVVSDLTVTPALNIVMAAPTGKAAARLTEAINHHILALPDDENLRRCLPSTVLTLHRLLGMRPGVPHCRYHSAYPLSLDVLIVDEASMVDLELMACLVNALPPHARLVLLGDPQQLPSIEIGNVLAELCQQVVFSEDMSHWLQLVCGQRPLGVNNGRFEMLNDCVIQLTENHRFGAASGIAQLATAVQQGETKTVLSLFDDLLTMDINWGPSRTNLDKAVWQQWQPYFQSLTKGPENAFIAFSQFMLLAVSRGDVHWFNEQLERLLSQLGVRRSDQIWYPGRAVMVIENNYALNVFNGDIGLTLPTEEGLRVFFPDNQGNGFRAFSPLRLPKTESAFAMTVHKSQGSEFGCVWLLLPEEDTPILTRELIYTALTRARQDFSVSGETSFLTGAIARREQRISGLYDRIMHMA